jgi:NAD(P)-dependent dehydrogenase (short-subunit alcohol dehydrogenase family)
VDRLFELQGRVALVTGGASGVGRMIAEGLLAHGARVYLTSRSVAACVAAAAALGKTDDACQPLPADVTDPGSREALAAELERREGRLDILVNNAGVGRVTAFETAAEDDWDQTLTTNLKAPFFLTQSLAPLLQAAAGPARPAKVINIASIDGLGVNAAESYAYQASKAALVQLTRRLAARLIADHIVVSGIAPGAFPSEMNTTARDTPDALAAITPAGRVGMPEDIAGAVVFLASRAGDYVVGQTLAVDGGCLYANATHGRRPGPR